MNHDSRDRVDWSAVRLVVFDIDGTLYRQRPLRVRIGRDLTLYSIWNRDLKVASILAKYRHFRERMGEQLVVDFEPSLITKTAEATGSSSEAVCAAVSEWMERRPLPYLRRCMYPGVRELFDGLRRHEKCIGVLSDYPARDKLAAMGLWADHIVSAHDEGIGVLKPHTRGLEHLISAAKASANDTIVIGDRADRDGEVATQVGARCLIRSSKPIAGYRTFRTYDDQVFSPLVLR